ncbi:hypothetical protein [Streptomyces sp. BE133]|uniref:hypothetical protein n=1 Tax=Streptomyces sp. BE133 TaxID=3002523 RepID=UPI002E75DC59|nr:hypothetical protein [Streptomyces sp. BE133]MEE1805409.1 hypothetical protein [Streptomyces sp. BE133]
MNRPLRGTTTFFAAAAAVAGLVVTAAPATAATSYSPVGRAPAARDLPESPDAAKARELLAGLGVADEAVGVICGTDGRSGLTVGTAHARDCATALQVASAYTRSWNSGGEGATTVHAAGSVWSCREQPGPLNPYQECVETGGTGRWVTLTS